jgi:hypothetical protein
VGERLVAQWLGNQSERMHRPSFEIFPQSQSVFCNDFWAIQIMFLSPAVGQGSKLVLVSSAWPGSIEMTRTTTDVPEPSIRIADPKIYDGFVGEYRREFLFGLFHVGPTLNISHETNELGSHLIARVHGLPATEFFPVSETNFIVNPTTAYDIRLTFIRNKEGKTTGATVFWDGDKIQAARISNRPEKREAGPGH